MFLCVCECVNLYYISNIFRYGPVKQPLGPIQSGENLFWTFWYASFALCYSSLICYNGVGRKHSTYIYNTEFSLNFAERRNLKYSIRFEMYVYTSAEAEFFWENIYTMCVNLYNLINFMPHFIELNILKNIPNGINCYLDMYIFAISRFRNTKRCYRFYKFFKQICKKVY